MEIEIEVEKYFSDQNLRLLKKKAKQDQKPLEIVILELCDFLMEQKELSDVLRAYVAGKAAPDIQSLHQKYKVEFIKLRKEHNVKG